MGKIRQRYNDEFKMKTVKYIQEQTKTVPQIAEELNIPEGTLHEWMRLHRKFENEPVLTPEHLRDKDRQIERQAREIEDLQEEIAILKKAMHIFSKERN
ncbi:transposase [Paenibacillus flagellatus]|uniref:Transposase n=1 Tax=Paenibacillus flagellatus TaxID=2211139 RepID=A0A2V5K744_9BACL|nr:transposase [Paenibacillus flagellatus]PYI53734.1 transposase [Paenibacillus flagellatus]